MKKDLRIIELAPCGVFCGACPSFGRSCMGCPSEDTNQKRVSKWSCKIRGCCYEAMNLDYCIYCAEFPCKKMTDKLLASHVGDPRFAYRHEVISIFPKLLQLGEERYHQYQKNRWICPSCAGRVLFYEYRCVDCGRDEIAIE